MRAYICRIYLFNYTTEKAAKSEWPHIQKPAVARRVTDGWNARHAAAKAYVSECGILRASFLQPLGCPIAVILFETSARRVWRAMKGRNTWTGSSYFFDNGTEIFYVTSFLLIDHLRTQRQLQVTPYSTN